MSFTTDDLSGKVFLSPLAANTDIHGGGHFFWDIYRIRLEFRRDGTVEMKKIILENRLNDGKHPIFTGTWHKPQVGYYTVNAELTDAAGKIRIRISGQLVNPTLLLTSEYTTCGGDSSSKSGIYELGGHE
jgi:hypothetical protein